MFRKFFAAVIVGLLVMSSQIASAAEIEWFRVKHIATKTELARYIENARQRGQNFLPVILINGLTVSINEFIQLSPSSIVSQEIVSNNGQDTRVIYRLLDYPGTRVANAYISYIRGDNSKWNALTAEEKRLYNVAVGIVNEANKLNDVMVKEYYIYREIINRADYLTGNMSNQPRFVTAIGALLDGKANCQGYTDAFYMLGRMCGFNVGRMSGQAGGGGHAWNIITFEDGKTYCVDATWGDGDGEAHPDIYFNAPVEIMQVTHSWDASLYPPIQSDIDGRYPFGREIVSETYGINYSRIKYKGGFVDTERATNAESGLKLLAQKILNGYKNGFTVMVPYDERYSDYNKMYPHLINEMRIIVDEGTYDRDIGDNITLASNVYSLGKKYLFFWARIKS